MRNPFKRGEIPIPSYPDKESTADTIMGDKKFWLKKQPSVFMIDMNIFGVK